MKRLILVVTAATALTVAAVVEFQISPVYEFLEKEFRGPATVDARASRFQADFDARLRPLLAARGLAPNPPFITLAFFKDRKRLDLYAGGTVESQHLIKSYRVRAASGGPGPKLREGDHQVPEGIYGIESLNPNSSYHLALRVNYPNAWDRARAAEERRTNLGGDIMIHGSNVSVGCLALGDAAIEELFVLAAHTDLAHWEVILAPRDFRVDHTPPPLAAAPPWIGPLYSEITAGLGKLSPE